MGADLYINKVFKPTSKKYEALFNEAVAVRNALPDGSTEHKKAQKTVTKYYDLMYSTGYFRDSYNNTDLLWQFDMSWWSDMRLYIGSQGRMSVINAQALLRELKEREPIFEQNLADLLAKKNRVWDYQTDFNTDKKTLKPDEMTDKERIKWVAYYRRKYTQFKSFLKEAIKLKTGIDASV